MKYFKNKETKKFLGFFMALAMVVSMMPGVAKAATTSPKVVITNSIKTSPSTITTGESLDVSAVVAVTSSAVSGCTVTVTVKAKKGYAIATGASLKAEIGSKDYYEFEDKTSDKATSATYVAEKTYVVIPGDKEIPVTVYGKLDVKKVSNGNSTGSTSTTAPTASATPSVAPTASAAPTASVAPSASAAPTASVAPTASTAPTASASAAPTVAPTKAPATVKVGTKKTVNGGKYKATKGNTVTYTAPSKKTAKVTIPATVKINGVTCKVTTIGKGAFKGNTKIKTVSLGKNITKIEANAFKGCKNLKTITIKSTSLTKKNVAKTAFKGINKKATFKVPAKKVKAYKTVVKNAGAPKTVKVKK